jgi:hypothetical protein
MISFTDLYNLVIGEKKDKTLSGYDYYKMIRKATPPTGTAFKDKKKYNRKDKYKDSHRD